MKKKNGSKTCFPTDKLDSALAFTEDLLTRALCPFVLLGETAKGAIEDEAPMGGKIEVGVMERYLTKDTFGIMRLIAPHLVRDDNVISFQYDDVPVEIKIIKRTYPFLENPNTIFYRITEYRVPNPFGEYWKVRGLVK